MLAAILAAGFLGTGAELLLLEHFESVRQIVPMLLLGFGGLTLAALVATPSGPLLRLFRLTMWLSAASGVAGMWLHYQGNVAFEVELAPDAAGWLLFREALKGATPALAPGAMTLLGALGLTYTFRHPAGE